MRSHNGGDVLSQLLVVLNSTSVQLALCRSETFSLPFLTYTLCEFAHRKCRQSGDTIATRSGVSKDVEDDGRVDVLVRALAVVEVARA